MSPLHPSAIMGPTKQAQAALSLPREDPEPQQLKSELLKAYLAGNTHRWLNKLIYLLVTEIEAKQVGGK